MRRTHAEGDSCAEDVDVAAGPLRLSFRALLVRQTRVVVTCLKVTRGSTQENLRKDFARATRGESAL